MAQPVVSPCGQYVAALQASREARLQVAPPQTGGWRELFSQPPSLRPAPPLSVVAGDASDLLSHTKKIQEKRRRRRRRRGASDSSESVLTGVEPLPFPRLARERWPGEVQRLAWARVNLPSSRGERSVLVGILSGSPQDTRDAKGPGRLVFWTPPVPPSEQKGSVSTASDTLQELYVDLPVFSDGKETEDKIQEPLVAVGATSAVYVLADGVVWRVSRLGELMLRNGTGASRTVSLPDISHPVATIQEDVFNSEARQSSPTVSITDMACSSCGTVLACRIFGVGGKPAALFRVSVDMGGTWQTVWRSDEEDLIASKIMSVGVGGGGSDVCLWVSSAQGERSELCRIWVKGGKRRRGPNRIKSRVGHVTTAHFSADGCDASRIQVEDESLGATWHDISHIHESEVHCGGTGLEGARGVVDWVYVENSPFQLRKYSNDWDQWVASTVAANPASAIKASTGVVLSDAFGLTAETLGVDRAPITVQSGGTVVHGYATQPTRGRRAEGILPAVLRVHGGPATHETSGFHPIDAFLANRGYFVLALNYRGSTSSRTGMMEGMGDVSETGASFTDLITGLEWLNRQEFIDHTRVGIIGESFGGYLALCLALADSEHAIACVAAHAPVVDWEDILQRNPDPRAPWLQERLQKEVTAFCDLRSMSAARTDLPMLVGHGRLDPLVSVAGTRAFVASRRNHASVEYLEFPRSGHRFDLLTDATRWGSALELFLSQHLGGRFYPPSRRECIEYGALRLIRAGA